MISQSEQINELATALAKAQATIEDVGKDATNPHFRSKYASLPNVLQTIRPVFAPHGLSLVQFPCHSADGYGVCTQVSHSSGQWMRCVAVARPMKDDPQGVGSLITYLRRYAAQGAAGIAADDDDDGQAASLPHGVTRGSDMPRQAERANGNGHHSSPPRDEPRRDANIWRGKLVGIQNRTVPIKTGANAGKTSEVFDVVLEGDRKAGTFDKRLAEKARALSNDDVNVVATVQPGRKPGFWELVSITQDDDLLDQDATWDARGDGNLN